MKKLILLGLITIGCFARLNDPFSSSYERDKITLKAVATCKENKKSSAICEFKNKTYIVCPGDSIEHFNIKKISENSVELENKRTRRFSTITI